jgi:hypothetical protein
MADRLFAGSWYSTWNAMIQRAVADVGRLDRTLFSDPALGGALQKIVEKYSVGIAHLNTGPKAILADPVEVERYADDYGDRRLLKIKRLRITIPFTGEAESLRIAPSRSAIPSHGAEIGKNYLRITIADDENADREVKTFCDQVQNNLAMLRQEYERDKPQLEQAVSQAAERRKAEIAAENDRDSERSFAVRR